VTTAQKAVSEILSGIVIKSEVKAFKPFDRFSSPNTERKDVRLLIALQTDDDRDIWFYSPKAFFSISSPPGCPIAVCTVLENAWIGSEEAKGMNVCGKTPTAKVHIGDRLRIQGRRQRETRYGVKYTHAKLLEKKQKEET